MRWLRSTMGRGGGGIQEGTASAPSSSSSFPPFYLQMILRCSPLLALLALVVSAGYYPRSQAALPINAFDGHTNYTGSCKDSLCSWFGIRYAAPPVGNLRFAPPQAAPLPTSPYDALKMGSRCPQAGSTDDQDEDCLFLNIQRPTTEANSRKLPVLVFFHGGGFESGSGNVNDPSDLIEIGRKYKQSALVVRINYRLGLFGFLAGSELEKERNINPNNVALNLGFQDMKRAILWVKEHIDAFGGDAERLTIWGQSAGSFGASALLLGFPTGAPFQAAVLESGAPGGVPIVTASSKDTQYERVLESTHCTSDPNHLSCLRSVAWKDLLNISLAESSRAMQPATYARGYYAWTGILDGGPSHGGFFADRPSQVINRGSFAHVPILHGDCLDEGTYFVPTTFNDSATFTDWISRVYFADPTSANTVSLVNQVLLAYPDVPAEGSPYEPIGASSDDRFFGPTNQYKRAASLYGDIRYQSNRRFFLSALAKQNVKAYSYLYAQEHKGDAPRLGVPHGSDLSALLQSAPNSVSVTYARQYLSFATSHNPNDSDDLPTWPLYTTSDPAMLQYRDDKITTIRDDFRANAIDVLNSDNILQVTSR